MANTYVKINSVTVGPSESNEISFNNIPQIYSDLKIVVSSRRTAANIWGTYSLRFNSDSTNLYTWREVKGDGSAASATENTTTNSIKAGEGVGSGSGANIFDNTEIDIPQYCSNVNYKQVNILSSGENNATTAYQGVWVGRWSSYNPITSISIIPGSGNFAQYSTFTLYGVFNADVSSAPATPTIGTATATGTTTASVAFTEVSNAASYTATSTPGSITATGTTSPLSITGLTTDTSYTFTVKSNNPFGSSANSASSNSVVPSSAVYESIATATVGAGGSSTVTFSSIPQTYTHLQIRFVAAGSGGNIPITFNGSGSGYTWHYNAGTGSATQNSGGTSAASSFICHAIKSSTDWTSGVCDITEYNNTSKGKTFRSLTGVSNNTASGNWIITQGGIWNNTSAITSITLGSATLAEGSKFALYGVRS